MHARILGLCHLSAKVDGHVKVTVSSEIRGDKTWESEDGWERHSYFAYASWSSWARAQVSDVQ